MAYVSDARRSAQARSHDRSAAHSHDHFQWRPSRTPRVRRVSFSPSPGSTKSTNRRPRSSCRCTLGPRCTRKCRSSPCILIARRCQRCPDTTSEMSLDHSAHRHRPQNTNSHPRRRSAAEFLGTRWPARCRMRRGRCRPVMRSPRMNRRRRCNPARLAAGRRTQQTEPCPNRSRSAATTRCSGGTRRRPPRRTASWNSRPRNSSNSRQ